MILKFDMLPINPIPGHWFLHIILITGCRPDTVGIGNWYCRVYRCSTAEWSNTEISWLRSHSLSSDRTVRLSTGSAALIANLLDWCWLKAILWLNSPRVNSYYSWYWAQNTLRQVCTVFSVKLSARYPPSKTPGLRGKQKSAFLL